MTIKDALNDRQMSIYRLAKLSGIAYATVNDICNGKRRLEKCSAGTIYRLAKALNISMEELLAPCMTKRPSFENFKSTICHRVKDMGDLSFIIDTLERKDIRTYYEWKWYPECLYLLAMLDYISRINDVPLCHDYEDIRRCKLEKPIYPTGVIILSDVMRNDEPIKRAEKEAIPEFLRFNIIESNVRDIA